MDEQEIKDEVVGKIITGVEKWDHGVTLTFDDGSSITFKACGAGETRISVEK